MTTPSPERTAAWLAEQHELRQSFRGLEPWPATADEAYAYAVQEAFLARRTAAHNQEIAGYKIGLTTPRMQTLCRGDRPISGVMARQGIRRSPAQVSTGDFVHLGIESELAVRLARAPVATATAFSRADIAAAVGEVAAAFELIEDRHADYTTLDWLWMAAENSWHAGLVLGPPASPRDIADLAGVLRVDGKEIDRGSTRDVLGHPLDAVAWLANHLAERGIGLVAGQWISTGSIATIRFAQPGQLYRFEIEGLAPVDLTIAT
jgi:2-keto-4-pentenoate hydratase